MATPLSAAKMLKALKDEGLDVQEYKSWKTHNRNSKGPAGPRYGVMIHHTVSSSDDSSVALCYNGHSSLPGPLCHAVGRNDGRVALVGHGRANHAGLGDPDVLAAVKAERALPADNEATVDGNAPFYGFETVNLGDGVDTYPWVQYVAVVKWATAICRAHGWTERSVLGHKEWQPGKIDPKGPVIGPDGKRFDFDMDRFRADVKQALALPAGQWQGGASAPPEKEEDVALSVEDIRKIFNTDGVIKAPTEGTNTHWEFESYVINTFLEAQRARLASERQQDQISKIAAQVATLSVSGVDLDALATKVADKLAARLAE